MSRGEYALAPRRDLRERELPWAFISIPRSAAHRKRPWHPHGDSFAVVACSRAASSSIGRSNPRVVTAVPRVAGRPSVGVAVSRAGHGVRAMRASVAVGSSRSVIGSGFRCPCCPHRLNHPHRPRRPVSNRSFRLRPRHPKRARASAQGQFLRIVPFVRASVRVVTRCSRSSRRCRHSGSVRASAAGRCATCWTVKRVTVAGVGRGIGRGLVDRNRCRRGRRDVFTGCASACVPRGSLVPPKTAKATGGFRYSRSPVPSR